MNEIKPLVEQLANRLPELQWRLRDLSMTVNEKTLSPGLFQKRTEMTAQTCFAEIQQDLQRLHTLDDLVSAHYLARRIDQKIQALVSLCRLYPQKPQQKSTSSFGVEMIATRQQWLTHIGDEVKELEAQRKALLKQLKYAQEQNLQSVLTLKAQLGNLEQQLTTAQEMLADKKTSG